jgi:hypothetical protein
LDKKRKLSDQNNGIKRKKYMEGEQSVMDSYRNGYGSGRRYSIREGRG